jgi:hypothetical protein
MVVRNASTLDAMIGAGLSDSATELASLALQEVSLRDVALAVRRDMREEAEGAGCAIEVSPSLGAPTLPDVLTDSAAFELALRSVVSVALSRARRGSTLTVGLRGREEGKVVVGVSEGAEPAGNPRREGATGEPLSFAETLLGRAGGRVWREGGGTVLLEIPVAAPKGEVAALVAEERSVEREIRTPSMRRSDDLSDGGGPSAPASPSPSTRPSLHAGDDLAGARQGDHR